MDESQLATAMDAYRRAVGRAGGQAPFGRLTGIKQQTTSKRLAKSTPLQSQDEVLKVEAATGVSRHELRPDLYPREESPRAPAGNRGLDAGGSSSSSLEGVQA